MKKMLSMPNELNAALRAESFRVGKSANALIVELLEREYMGKKPVEGIPPKVEPVQEGQEQKEPRTVEPIKEKPVEDMPKINSVGKKREGEPTATHKEGMFLQRKQNPKGILSNGECFRREDPNGKFVYKYFIEEFEEEDQDEPF